MVVYLQSSQTFSEEVKVHKGGLFGDVKDSITVT
jgi:hypothetical protein